jgi:hypothetical protein
VRLITEARRSRALILFALATLAYCSTSINFSWIQTWNNSDSIIPALISIEKYSPFYWSENRFGMLLPLLASPVRDYGWNLLLQSQLIILSAAGCIILLHLIDSNRGNEPAVRVPITALLLLCFYKPVASVVLLLPGSPYFVSLFLLLSGIYLFTVAQSRPVIRWTGAAVLVLLSFWVNISNIVIAAIAIAIWPRRIGFRARISAAGLVVLSAALVTMFSAQYPGSDFRQLVSIEGWLGALLQMIGNVKTTMRGSAIATAVGAAVLFESINRHRTQWQYSPRDALAIAATAQIGATAASSWVALNGFDSRYITGPVFLIL